MLYNVQKRGSLSPYNSSLSYSCVRDKVKVAELVQRVVFDAFWRRFKLDFVIV